MHTLHRHAVVFMRVVTFVVGACLSAVAAGQAPAQWHVPLQKEGATVKISEHVYVIPDFKVGMVPNVGIVVGSRATLVVDPGMGLKNGQVVLREVQKVSQGPDIYIVNVKARLLYETGHLSRPIFRNIARITRIRNELAHTLSLNPDKLDFKFDTDYGEAPGEVELKKQVRRANNPVKKYPWLLCFGTLSQVQRAYYQRFNSWPLFDRPLEM